MHSSVWRHRRIVGDSRTILITGAAGNLGSLLARRLIPCGQPLRLMYHRRPLPDDIVQAPNVTPVQADLGHPRTLSAAVNGADVVVHFAGVLFAPRPEHFLPETNTQWFANLLAAALDAPRGGTASLGAHGTDSDSSGCASAGHGLWAWNLDDRRRSLAGEATPSVRVAEANVDATRLYHRLSQRDRGRNLQPRCAGHLPRRGRATGYIATLPG